MGKYKVTSPTLPPHAKRRDPDSPIMSSHDMEYWLNKMDEMGWEFISYGAKHWLNLDKPIEYWVFKQKETKPDQAPKEG